MNTIFITILIIVIIGISLYERCEYFADTNNKNPFFTKIPNIFYTKQFTDNLFIPPKPKKSTLLSINTNSFFDSDIVSNKILCSSITNQGKCWDNNICQWVEKYGQKSYCTLAPKFLL